MLYFLNKVRKVGCIWDFAEKAGVTDIRQLQGGVMAVHDKKTNAFVSGCTRKFGKSGCSKLGQFITWATD